MSCHVTRQRLHALHTHFPRHGDYDILGSWKPWGQKTKWMLVEKRTVNTAVWIKSLSLAPGLPTEQTEASREEKEEEAKKKTLNPKRTADTNVVDSNNNRYRHHHHLLQLRHLLPTEPLAPPATHRLQKGQDQERPRGLNDHTIPIR